MPANRRPANAASGREAGSIAILALWSVAIIAVLLAAATTVTSSGLRITRNTIAASQARLAAEAGTRLGLLRLLQRRAEGEMVFDGRSEAWQDGSTRVEISIVDEAGKIDLNQAPIELLSGLFAAVGRPREMALLLACNILDRRGEVGAGCPEPAEPTPATARHRLFVAPEQLAQLPGIDDSLYQTVADDVTVMSGASAVDPLVASRTVLLAIPGASPALVEAYLTQRAAWHDLAGMAGGAAMFRAMPYVTISPARDFTVQAVATTAAGARSRAEWQIRLTGRPNHPYELVAARAPPVERGRNAAPPERRRP